jgi:putative ABC transport system substrate-binding protein
VRGAFPRHASINAPGWRGWQRSRSILQFVVEQTHLAGKTAKIEIAPTILARGTQEIEAALANVKREAAGAVVVQASLASKELAELAIMHGLAAATVPRSFAEAGGMLSYGADSSTSFRQSARFVTKILQGGLPADMPIEQPTKPPRRLGCQLPRRSYSEPT